MARKGDLLCGDCSRAFTLMLDLLRRHPGINAADLGRIKEVFEWQSRNTNPLQPTDQHPRAEIQSQCAASSATHPDHACKPTEHVCEVCGNPLTQSANLLCAECSRAHTFVLELFRESAPLVQTRLQSHPELTADDLNHIRRVFIWRSSKIGLLNLQPQTDVTVHA